MVDHRRRDALLNLSPPGPSKSHFPSHTLARLCTQQTLDPWPPPLISQLWIPCPR